jgi:hypothetical protein
MGVVQFGLYEGDRIQGIDQIVGRYGRTLNDGCAIRRAPYAATLLNDMSEFVGKQLLAIRRTGAVFATSEEQVGSGRERTCA